MLSAILPSIIMLSVIILSVIMLSVVAPSRVKDYHQLIKSKKTLIFKTLFLFNMDLNQNIF
jgi:hypothetical protein